MTKFENKQKEMSNEKLIELAEKEIQNLCKTGGKSFNMSVPVSIKDTDMLLSEVVRRFKEHLKQNKNDKV